MNQRLRLGAFFFAAFYSCSSFAAGHLHLGRYLGYIEPLGGDRKIAVTMDLFKVKPNDSNLFPILNAAVKLGLGGLQSGEYVTYLYEDLRYDFTGGTLSFDSPENDLVISSLVSGTDQSVVEGQVLVRSAGVMGTIHLVELSDEPDSATGVIPSDQYKPLLAGQYRGLCDHRQSLLQIETVRGLEKADADTRGLAGYSIVGRLGFPSDAASCTTSPSCAMRNYSSGSFDVFRNRLILHSGTNDECQVSATGVTCSVYYGATPIKCDLVRDPTPIADPKFYSRGLFVSPTAAERAKLPEVNPPGNTELMAAVQGAFTGYIHHENSNLYQVLRLNVLASTSTDNTHNENLVYVTGSAMAHFGRSLSNDFFVQQFEHRTFYVTEAFTLESVNADMFFQVKEWRQGFVQGVAYSHAFGRIGTFEVIKGAQLPTFSSAAKFLPSVVSDFTGPQGYAPDLDNLWHFDLTTAVQSFRRDISTLQFQGSVAFNPAGTIPRRAVDRGSFDFYTGAIGLEVADGRVISGKVADSGTMNLFWPGVPSWGVLLPFDHNLYPYRH
jgi:hypothetical protein